MKKSLSSLAALAVIAATSGLPQIQGGFQVPTISDASAKTQPGERNKQGPSDTKSARIGTGYVRRWKSPVGKRNRWSVKQGQRLATKAKNVARHRAAHR